MSSRSASNTFSSAERAEPALTAPASGPGPSLLQHRLIWLGALAAFLVGWAAESWDREIARDEMRRDVLLLAEAAAAAIDTRALEGMSPAALETESLRRLRRQFYAFSRIGFEGIRLSVSFPDDSGFMVGTGQFLPVSRAASDWSSVETRTTVASGRSRVVGPYSTRDGSFVGAFVPVKDARSGQTVLVVAAEADADHWQKQLRGDRRSMWPFVLLVAALLVGSSFVLTWRDGLAPARRHRMRHLEALAVALVGLVVTAAAAISVHDYESRSRDLAFLQLSRERAIAIRDAFHEIRDHYLAGAAGLFGSSSDVSREEFEAFVRPILRAGFIDAMNWAAAVPPDRVPAFEEQVRASGVLDFRVYPTPFQGREALYPILYREPLAENRAAIGFDLGSEPIRRAALEDAVATGLATASDAVELVGDKRTQTGILGLRPVFANQGGAGPHLQGFVLAVVRMGPLIDRAAAFRGGEGESVLAELYQVGVGGSPVLLASTAPSAGVTPQPGLMASGVRPGTVFPIFFLGKTYAAALRPGPAFGAAYPRRAGWLTAAGGLVVTASLSGFAGLVANRRRRLERAVEERTARLASIIRATRAGTWEWNIRTGEFAVDDRWAGMLGYTRDELSPMTRDKAEALMHPADHGSAMKLLLAHIDGDIAYYDHESRMQHKTGQWVWVQSRGAVVMWDGAGKPVLMSGTHTDITLRKRAEEAFQRSEEKLRLAVDATSDGLWDWDVQTGVIEWSARSYAMLGYQPQEFPLTYDRWRDLVHPDDRSRVLAEVERKLHAREQLAIEFRYQRRDGTPLWVMSRGRVVGTDGEGFPVRMVGTHTDIDRRRKAEEEAVRAREEAEMASRAKSEFLANTSHELRTPLNSIIGFSSALVSGVFGPIANAKHREYLGDIESSGRHLLALINDILDLSAVEAGKLDLLEEDIDVEAACAAVMRFVKLRADQGRVKLTSSLPAGLPRLWADERRFKQVLLNLLSNAIKFTPAQGTVDLSARIESDGALSMIVTDTGIGMDDEGMRRAMMEFMRVDSSLSRKHEGAGLGLPLSRQLMQRHGGTLHLASEPGRGTVATATFPAGRVRSRASVPAQAAS